MNKPCTEPGSGVNVVGSNWILLATVCTEDGSSAPLPEVRHTMCEEGPAKKGHNSEAITEEAGPVRGAGKRVE